MNQGVNKVKNVIIGTAGHIDHGKTALIKVLTGTDTDRLKEEKKRGITIDLGFAYLDLPDGERAGIIDVPGHEKFVKNMLAGVGGIDMVLLVISAEEGVMPQTREHLNILSILQIQKGIIVLTKSDLVDPDWLSMITEDVRAYVAGTFLQAAPIIPVSAITGEGIDHLRSAIYEMTKDVTQKDMTAGVRVPIDRVFSADGFGTVITGTQVEGTLNVGDVLTIYPQNKTAKIKNIQMHGKNIDKSFAGQRVAINLAGVKRDELTRGNVLAKPDSMNVTMLLDVKLNLLEQIPRELKNRTRIRFYHGTSEILGRVVLLEGDTLDEGEKAYAQLRLEEHVAVKAGDHFVLRYYSPVETIGGGIVLDSNPYKHKRFKQDVLESLQIKESGDFEKVLEQTIKKYSRQLETMDFLAVQLGKEKNDLLPVIADLVEAGLVIKVTDQVVVHIEFVDQLEQKIEAVLSDYHLKNPLKAGIGKEELRSRVFQKEFGKLADAFIQYFADQKLIRVAGNTVSLYHFEVTLTEAQQKIQEKIEKTYLDSQFAPPLMEEMVKTIGTAGNGQQMIQSLIERGVLIKIDQTICLHQQRYEEALALIQGFIKANGQITLAECRDLLNTSRKYAVPLLEYMDQKKITKKMDEYRILI
jgi:selenocysteine-specific elongation factor